MRFQNKIRTLIICASCLIGIPLHGQESNFRMLTVDQAVTMARVNQQKKVQSPYSDFHNTANIAPLQLDVYTGRPYAPEARLFWEVNQEIPPLPLLLQNKNVNKVQAQVNANSQQLMQYQLIAEVKKRYYQWAHLHLMLDTYHREKALYAEMKNLCQLRYDLGDISLLEKVKADNQYALIRNKYVTCQDELTIATNNLKELINANNDFVPATDVTYLYEIHKHDTSVYRGSNALLMQKNNIIISKQQYRQQKAMRYPSVEVGLYQHIFNESSAMGMHVGLNIPLAQWITGNNTDQAHKKWQQAMASEALQQSKVQVQIDNLLYELNKYFKQVRYYQENANNHAQTLVDISTRKYESEEIDFFEYSQNMFQALETERQYLQTILKYNMIAIALEFYVN